MSCRWFLTSICSLRTSSEKFFIDARFPRRFFRWSQTSWSVGHACALRYLSAGHYFEKASYHRVPFSLTGLRFPSTIFCGEKLVRQKTQTTGVNTHVFYLNRMCMAVSILPFRLDI